MNVQILYEINNRHHRKIINVVVSLRTHSLLIRNKCLNCDDFPITKKKIHDRQGIIQDDVNYVLCHKL